MRKRDESNFVCAIANSQRIHRSFIGISREAATLAAVNHFFYLGSLWAFLLLPVALLGFRWRHPRMMPWWLMLLTLSLVGWLLVNATVHTYYAYLDDVLAQYGKHPPEYLIKRRTNDGAKLVFALFFGWMYGPFYSVPWLGLYGVTHLALWVNTRGRKRAVQ